MSKKYLISEEELKEFLRAKHFVYYHYCLDKYGDDCVESSLMSEQMTEEELQKELKYYKPIEEA